MDTPHKRHKSWFSSLTGLVSGGRPSAQDDVLTSFSPSISKIGASASNDRVSSRTRLARLDEQTPVRNSGTFSAPPVDSPESPAKRASPTMLAQRKLHDRVQGPSSRLGSASGSSLVTGNGGSSFQAYNKSAVENNHAVTGSSRFSATPRRTNFLSATTPRNMFRESTSDGVSSFTFTPRVPANTMRGSFPATTPGRSYRASGVEMSAREMAKVSSSDLFPMKIPDPDAALSGEAVSDMIPKELKASNRSIYASEYLAHLCPPDFNEEQRNQFFCILDLRRLKYAADEVFSKKDWRLNILNFAKEYEKNRSLIMLRYGLYEFKTVKVSKDVFQKWKAANNIPDVDEEDVEGDAPTSFRSSTSAKAGSSLAMTKPNGTEGILRAGKRKAQDNIDPSATKVSSVAPSTKRSRPAGRAADREPLVETSTPALNKSKRKATGEPAASTPSATKSFFEKVANSTSKEDPASTPAAKSSLFKSSTTNQLFKSSNSGSLARSVLENGLKSSATTNNIFAHLSDSSAKASGREDGDSEDSEADDDAEDEAGTEKKSSDAAEKTPSLQSASSLFTAKPAAASSGEPAASSNASTQESDAPSGRSLFDRINKNSDGQPMRMFGSSTAAPSMSSPAPLFGSKPTPEGTGSEKESTPALFGGANKTWSTDSPIKFAPTSSTTPAPPKALFGAPGTPTSSSTNGVTAASAPLFGASTPGAAAPSASASTPALFGGLASKSAESSSAPSGSATPSFFGAAKDTPGPSSSLFGKAPEKQESASSVLTTTPAPAPSALFGATASTANKKRGADDDTAQPPAKATFPSSNSTSSLFGSAGKSSASGDEPSAKRPLFGGGLGNGSTTEATPAAPTPLLSSFGAPKPNGEAKDKPLFGASPAAATEAPKAPPLFGSATPAGEPSKAPALFGAAAVTEAPKAPALFGAAAATEAPKAPALFGAAAATEAPKAPTLFGSAAPASQASKAPPLFGNAAQTTEAPKPPVLFGGAAAATEAPKAPALFGSAPPVASSGPTGSLFAFGGENNKNGNASAAQPSTGAPLFSFSSSTAAPAQTSFASTPSFTGGNGTNSAGSSFTFNLGGASKPFNNPFASGGDSMPSFGAGTQQDAAGPSTSFPFGGDGGAPKVFSFGAGASQQSTQNGTSFGSNASGNDTGAAPMFSFGASGPAQSNSMPLFGQQPVSAPPSFLAPPAGASSGTNTPFTNLGGASSLATTPAAGTPEPGATQNNADNSGHQADGDEAPQVQVNLAEGVSGEEDEDVVHEVRAKVLRLVPLKEANDGDDAAAKKSPWKTEGVGPLRVLKHKETGVVRLLLRGEPRGHIVLNRVLLPNFSYKPDAGVKYVKLTTGDASGNGLETYMLQVKTKDAAQTLGDKLEEYKAANKKDNKKD